MVPEKAPLVTGTTLRTTGSLPPKYHWYAIAGPHKLGIDPLAGGDIHEWTVSRKAGGIPRESTRFSLSVESEQADAGRDGQTCIMTLNSQAQTGTEKN